MDYTYTPDGKLSRRTWARGVTTDYEYAACCGSLLSIDYSDVSRHSGEAAEADAMGTLTRSYDTLGRPVGLTASPTTPAPTPATPSAAAPKFPVSYSHLLGSERSSNNGFVAAPGVDGMANRRLAARTPRLQAITVRPNRPKKLKARLANDRGIDMLAWIFRGSLNADTG